MYRKLFVNLSNSDAIPTSLKNSELKKQIYESKKIISFFSHKNSTIEYSNIAIPVASFYEKSGTYTNKDGIKQKIISKIAKNNPQDTITSIIEHLKSMIEKGTL